MARVFYRIVKTDPPTSADFTSKMALGLVRADADAETRRLESGISVYRTDTQARRKARLVPALGRYIAAVQIEDDGSVAWERTTRSSGHHTLWGEPAAILARVMSIVPAR